MHISGVKNGQQSLVKLVKLVAKLLGRAHVKVHGILLLIKIVSHQNGRWMGFPIGKCKQCYRFTTRYASNTNQTCFCSCWDEWNHPNNIVLVTVWHHVVTDYLIICGLCCIRNGCVYCIPNSHLCIYLSSFHLNSVL